MAAFAKRGKKSFYELSTVGSGPRMHFKQWSFLYLMTKNFVLHCCQRKTNSPCFKASHVATSHCLFKGGLQLYFVYIKRSEFASFQSEVFECLRLKMKSIQCLFELLFLLSTSNVAKILELAALFQSVTSDNRKGVSVN